MLFLSKLEEIVMTSINVSLQPCLLSLFMLATVARNKKALWKNEI